MFQQITLPDEKKHKILCNFKIEYGSAEYKYRFELLESALYITVPQNFNSSTVNMFLKNVEFIFQKKTYKSLILDLFQTKTISILGLILIYKFVAYTATNRLTEFPIFNITERLDSVFYRIGLSELIDAYIFNANKEKAYNSLKNIEEEYFFIYPQILSRSEENSLQNVRSIFIETISDFYKKHKKVDAIDAISICIGELLMNFWAHATDESDTIVTAKGTLEKFTIVIADNGQGIISTLAGHCDSDNPQHIFSSCINRGVSSKKHLHHMGYGLFYISELTKINNGQLNIWSEGFHLQLQQKKKKVAKTGYWKGTIIELNLNLKRPKSLCDIDYYRSFTPTININFGDQ